MSAKAREAYCVACKTTWMWHGSLPVSHAACRQCMKPLERADKLARGTCQYGLPVARLRPVLRVTEINTKANT